MALSVYISTVSSNQEMKKHQSHIQDVLSSKKIEFEVVDVASNRDFLDKMREISGNPKALAPQICRGDQYIGGYDEFIDAVETSNLNDFLKL